MIEIDKLLCDRCGTCVAICPKNCITVYESCIEIDRDECINCQKCVWLCPIEALSYKKEEKQTV